MPQGWTKTFQRITIKGYNYRSKQGAWECVIGGYNYSGAPNGWVNYSAEIRGNAPFSIVKLGYDGSKCVILLGTTNTEWCYAKVAISDILVGNAIYNWETGWSASIVPTEDGLTKIVTPAVNNGVSADWNALINKPSTFAPSAHTHSWSGITDKRTGTTNYITMFTNGATGTIGNSQLAQDAGGVIASKGITANDFLQSNGPLYTGSHIYLINKPGDAWLSFATRDVSGSEAKFNLSNIKDVQVEGNIDVGAVGIRNHISLLNKAGTDWLYFATRDESGSEVVVDLSNVGSITPAGSTLNVIGDVFLQNNLQLIDWNGDPWTVIERNTAGSGNTARLKSIEKLNDINVSDSGFYRNGDIGISGNRVFMSRRNVGEWTTISKPGGIHLINLNDYPGVTRFNLVATSGDVIIGFYNGVIGDEIFVKCYNYNNPRILSGGDGTNWSVHDGQFFHFTCEGSATQKWGSSQYSANLWMKW